MPSVSLRPGSLLLALPLFALAACDSKTSEQAAAPTVDGVEVDPMSTDWATEDPTAPAVPVTLPETRMTNVPVAE